MVSSSATSRAGLAPLLSVFAFVSLFSTSRAQEPAPAAAPQGDAPVYGRVVVEQASLRCWSGAVAEPPVYEDKVVKDQVVQLGRSENGFRAVLLPLGPVGYVSKKLTAMADDGTVTTKGTKVSFRWRPRSTEAPVAQLVDGTQLFVIGEQDDWYRARVPGIEAWLAAAEVEVVDAPDAAMLASIEAQRAAAQAEVQARLDAIAVEQKQKEQSRIDLEAVRVVEAAFQKELDKPADQQQLAALTDAIGKLETTLAAESAARPVLASLKTRIETHQWIAAAIEARTAKPQYDEAANTPPPPTDRLERFESIGWLRYERHLAGPGVYYLEKGGRRQHLLSCNTGRYDLALFVGREVGVIGPRRQPKDDSLSVLDVERIEVLGAPTR